MSANPTAAERALPVDALRDTFLATRGPIVITAPTGSGKSTQVPRWAAEHGQVIVVEPRRVACRALASRVASLEGTKLGGTVGFQVRGETRVSDETRIRFVTPGIALAQFDQLKSCATVILDELHERRLDVDLLLALLMDEAPQLVVMSATLDGPRVADHLGATLLTAEGRLFPVDIKHRDGGETLPSPRELDGRIAEAIQQLDTPGDVLVFLPGKREIDAAEMAIGRGPWSVVKLHGGMSLDAQSRIFDRTQKRKIVLATNVAETSLTVPGITAVIDSGLVRRTSYHRGRAHLALVPIAQDAADQRAGRAGRTGPGVCIRLWARRAQLETHTPPEIHRESLVPLLLSAAACGRPDVDSLRLLDQPKEHALQDARRELQALGAIDEEGTLTPQGRQLSGLPIDASLGRLLVEARGISETALQDTIDLVSALASGRRMFFDAPGEEPPFRFDGCDAAGLVRAVRGRGGNVDETARRESRLIGKRLRKALSVDEPEPGAPVDSKILRQVALGADARAAHIVRRRGKGGARLALANGGTELALARESAVWKHLDVRPGTKAAEAVVVFDVRAFGTGKERRLLATCASPCDLHTLRELGLGERRLAKTWLAGKGAKRKVMAAFERVLADKVLDTFEQIPTGDVARDALFELMSRGSLFRPAMEESRRRIAQRQLAARLSKLPAARDYHVPSNLEAPPDFDEWLRARIAQLGIERGDELELLSPDDLLIDDLPFELRDVIASLYPMSVSLGDVTYKVEFDLAKGRAILNAVKGGRNKPPPRSFLPKFPGLAVYAEAARGLHRVS